MNPSSDMNRLQMNTLKNMYSFREQKYKKNNVFIITTLIFKNWC